MLVAAAGRRRQRRNRRLMNDLRKEPAAFVEVSSASSSAEDSSAPSPTRAPRQEFAGTAGATSSRSAQRPAKANKMGPAHKFGEPNGKRPWTTTEWLDTPVGAQKQEKEQKLTRPVLPDLGLRDLEQLAHARALACPHCGCGGPRRQASAGRQELSPGRRGGAAPPSCRSSAAWWKGSEAEEELLEAGSLPREGSHQSFKKERNKRSWIDAASSKKKTKVLCVCGAIWLVLGMLFFWSEGYGLVDSVYSLTQIVTTVGYGDIVPKTNYQKIITACIVLSSTLIMAGVVSHMIDVILEAQAEALAQTLRAKEEEIKSSQETPTSHHRIPDPGTRKAVPSRLAKLKSEAAVHAGIFICFIVAGTLFFRFFEACVCPEDFLGCPLDPDNCEDSGGIERSLVDTFYMAVVTITTVGYGDVVPQTLIGRTFSALYMLFGVGCTIHLVGKLTDLVKEAFEMQERATVTKESFKAMDMNGDGNLDRHEFLRLQLVMLGLAQEGELDSIDLQFDLIDSSGDGYISREEFHNFYG